MTFRSYMAIAGEIFYASYLGAGLTSMAFAGLIASAASRSIFEALTATLWILLSLSALLLWSSNINYVCDVLCRTRHSRPVPEADPTYRPMVSLHIPAYNEPPELLIETIKAVERIDYPNFEVVVMDNNTKDPAVWGPVEQYCRGRQRVRFVHVAPWPGYKAGACNLALRRYTDPRAEVIGLVDADDIVRPEYLRETVPYFCDPHLGFVQTCESNRDYEGSAYYTACVDSYKGFYMAVMSSRNERDSVPFVGTMGLFRRSALAEVGGWNEWCISEDTEASVRVLKAGWSGVYLPRCFGRGIVPPTYAGLNTQRYRWCFGAMQILRLHWRSFMPWDNDADNHLTLEQRRDYLLGCLGWMRDLIMVGFSLLLLAITGLLLSGSHFDLSPFAGYLSLLPMALILVATVCMTYTLQHWTGISFRRALLGLVISLSACWVTARACIDGLCRREGVFRRTSKTGASRHRLRAALRLSRAEALVGSALWASAGLLAARAHPPVVLIFVIATQGAVYVCSVAASLWNLRAQRVPGLEYRRRFAERRLRQAARRFSWAGAGLAGAVLASALVAVATASVAAPGNLLSGVPVHRAAPPAPHVRPRA
jgi:cellulose synthase/poly-beta-1,6-N-acetylglucosamine synthase-like glycosyltransferase